MSRPPLSRPRRRRWVIVAALAASVLLLAVDATVRSLDEDPERRLGFVDRLRPFVTQSAAAGDDLAALLDDLARLEPSEARRRADLLVAAVVLARDGVAVAESPVELTVATSLLVSALAVRADAVAAVADVVDGLVAGDPVDDLVAALEDATADLRFADDLHRRFTREVREAVDTDAELALGGGEWVGDAARFRPAGLRRLVTRARSRGVLVSVADVAVLTISVDPAPVVHEGPVAVLATPDPLLVTVVVANRGAVAGVLTVRAVMEGPAEPGPAATEAVALDPGEQRTVTLGPVAPPAVGDADLVVTVDPFENESSLGDNTRTLTVRVRDPGATTTTVPAGVPTPTSTPGGG